MAEFPQPVKPGERDQRLTHTTTFRHSLTGSKSEPMALKEYGYVADGKRIPEAYLVRISSIRNAATITSPLQEDINLKLESHWSSLLPTGLLQQVDKGAQLISGGRVSLITKATSRRVWTGSSPMVISLQLRFEAVFDPINEVVNPIRILAAMALPKETILQRKGKVAGSINELPFLGPPGPSPFLTEGVLGKSGNKVSGFLDSLQGGDNIQIELGRFLTFYDVIVKSVSPTIPIKFDPSGNPISATVNMVFETYEMMTAESFGSSFTSLIEANAQSKYQGGWTG